MKIAFRKITPHGVDFAVDATQCAYKGVIKQDKKLYRCKGELTATLAHYCDRCGDDITLHVDQPMELLISDGIYQSDEDTLDVVEFMDGEVDFIEICDSEAEAIKSDYHYCDKCKQTGE